MIRQLSAIIRRSRRLSTWSGSSGAARLAIIASVALTLASATATLSTGGCSPTPGTETQKRNNLDTMTKATIQIGNQPFEVWLALTDQQRELGLMQVTTEQLAPTPNPQGANLPKIEHGMLFVFASEQPLSFWMYNTISPLDIAYIAYDGRIVKTYTMAPMETRIYPSIEPAQFALEVRAGLFSELGITAGQHVEIPQSVLKSGS